MVNNLVFRYPKPLFFMVLRGPMVAPRAIFGPLGQSCEDPGCRQVANNLPVKAQDCMAGFWGPKKAPQGLGLGTVSS